MCDVNDDTSPTQVAAGDTTARLLWVCICGQQQQQQPGIKKDGRQNQPTHLGDSSRSLNSTFICRSAGSISWAWLEIFFFQRICLCHPEPFSCLLFLWPLFFSSPVDVQRHFRPPFSIYTGGDGPGRACCHSLHVPECFLPLTLVVCLFTLLRKKEASAKVSNLSTANNKTDAGCWPCWPGIFE